MLLDAWGDLDYFDCSTCEGYEQRLLGCGTAPIIEAPDTMRDLREYPPRKRQRFWTIGLWHEQAEMRREPASEELAEDLYEYASWAGVVGATGSPYRCCPAWYSRFAPQGAVDAAHHAVKLMRWRDSGALGAVSHGTLQQWEIDLVEIASRMYAAKERRDAQQAQANAKAKAAAEGRG